MITVYYLKPTLKSLKLIINYLLKNVYNVHSRKCSYTMFQIFKDNIVEIIRLPRKHASLFPLLNDSVYIVTSNE